jgi:hypothetical protein
LARTETYRWHEPTPANEPGVLVAHTQREKGEGLDLMTSYDNFQKLKVKTEEFGRASIGKHIDEVKKLAKAAGIWLVMPGEIVTMDVRVDRIFVELDDQSWVLSFNVS